METTYEITVTTPARIVTIVNVPAGSVVDAILDTTARFVSAPSGWSMYVETRDDMTLGPDGDPIPGVDPGDARCVEPYSTTAQIVRRREVEPCRCYQHRLYNHPGCQCDPAREVVVGLEVQITEVTP
jgi:hypothetical protein